MERRGFLEFIGGGGVGTLLGYYLGAKEVLGIQSEAAAGRSRSEPTPTATATSSDRSTPPEQATGDTLFFDDFTASGSGYDTEKWRVIKKTRFEGETISGDRFTQTGDDQMKMAPQSYESLYLESNATFEPPVEVTMTVASATPAYGSGVHLGFAMPGDLYPGKKDDRQGRGSMWKWSTDSVFVGYSQNGSVGVTTQKDSPLHTRGDTSTNQSGAGSYEGGLENTVINLVWRTSEVVLTIDGDEFTTTEDIPSDPMPFYFNGREWVGSDACSLTAGDLRIKSLQ